MEQENTNIATQTIQRGTSHEQPHKQSFKKYLPISCILLIILILFVGIIAIPSHKPTSFITQNQTATDNQTNPQTIQSSQQVNYTNTQLSAIQGSPHTTTALPLGDNKYTTTGPEKGYIYLCHVMKGGGGAQESGNWITGTTWNADLKPSVEGKVTWSNAQLSSTISGNKRIITGNDLPVNMTTGIFPIQSSDPAYQYDRNPNSIKPHTFTLTLPLNPTASSTPSCMGGEVGIMSNGVPLFNGFDAENRDAAAREIQDSCDGHPQEQDEYHYHSLSSCFKDIKNTTVLGYALDGYPITGPVLPNGNYLTTNDLDECHGMTSQITLDGKEVTTYHYVMTQDFPYSVSCFHAKPVQMQVIAMQQGQTNQQQTNQHVSQQLGQQGQSGSNNSSQNRQPPQEAFSVCSGKSTGASCSFDAPNGTVSGSCQKPPNQSSLVCVPTK